LRHPTFSRFSRTPTCDRHTDRQTHDHGIYRESVAHAVTNGRTDGGHMNMVCNAEFADM